jgi:1-phosphatidylinositol-3-phosphate 5-kinase
VPVKVGGTSTLESNNAVKSTGCMKDTGASFSAGKFVSTTDALAASVSGTYSGLENGATSPQPLANELNAKRGANISVPERQVTSFRDVSATFDAAWIGKGQSSKILPLSATLSDSSVRLNEGCTGLVSVSSDECISGKIEDKCNPNTLTSPSKAGPSNVEGWVGAPYSSFSMPSLENIILNSPIKPSVDFVSVSSIGSPSKASHHLVSIYDDEPTSIIAYAINSPEHQSHLFDKIEKPKENEHRQKDNEKTVLDNDWVRQSVDGRIEHLTVKHVNTLSSNGTAQDDPMLYTKAMHVKVVFTDETSQAKAKYTVTCYYAKQFDGLRKRCCPREDFIRSLCRCKKWGAQGGKSNVFFAKTADDRFVVKQVTKTELDSFITFAPAYFKYISDALITGSPTCLAKILGIYQV